MTNFPSIKIQAVDSSGNLVDLTESEGSLNVNVVTGGGDSGGPSSNVTVENFPTTQPVSGSVSLNAGSNIVGKVGIDPSTNTVQLTSGQLTALTPLSSVTIGAGSNAIGSVQVSNLPTTQPVSVTSLPLPSGAATSSLQTTGNTSLTSIDGKLTASSNRLVVDGSQVTQPISAASLPLPTGAAQDGIDISGASMPAGGSGIRGWLSAIFSMFGTKSNASTQPTGGSGILGFVSELYNKIAQSFNASTSSLNVTLTSASGIAQETGGNLELIEGKLPSLGQASTTGSIPVVLPSSQISSLTPLSSVTVSNLPSTQPVSGTVTISNTSIGISSLPALPTGSNTIGTVNLTSLPAGSNTIGAISNTSFNANQSGTWNVGISSSLPTGSNTIGAVNINPANNTVQLASGQLTALAPLSSVSINNFPGTQPVSIASLPSLPTGTNSIGSVSVSNLSGLGTDASLQQIVAAIKAQIQIADSIWTDNSGAYYIKQDTVNEGTGTVTVNFYTPTGSAATPGAGLVPASTTDKTISTEYYTAISAGTGYSIGDLLARTILASTANTPSSFTVVWMNLTTSLILSTAPTYSNLQLSNQSVSATQAGTWTVGVNSLPSIPSGTNIIGKTGIDSANNTVQLSGSQLTTLTPPSSVSISSLPSLPTGTNSIGSISNSSFGISGSLPTGSNTIGSVGISSGANTVQLSSSQLSTLTPLSSVAISNLPSSQPISAVSLPLPTGAALESGGNLATIATNTSKIPSQGQAAPSASLPVVLPTTQIAALTPLSTISIGNFPTTQAVSGTVTVGSLPSLPSGSNTIGSVGVNNFPATQVISAASLPLPTGAALESGGNLASISSKLPSTLGVKTSANSLSIAPASDASFSNANSTITGTLTTTSTTLTINTGALSGVGISITGTWVGTITFQGTIDGTNWFTIYAYLLPDSSYSYTTTANGQFFCCGAGLKQVQLSAALTSGTATVGMLATNNSPINTSQIRNTTLSATGTVTATQASTDVWRVALQSGNNTVGTVNVLPTKYQTQYGFSSLTVSSTQAPNTLFDCNYTQQLSYSATRIIMLVTLDSNASNAGTYLDLFCLQGELDARAWGYECVYTMQPSATDPDFVNPTTQVKMSPKYWRIPLTGWSTFGVALAEYPIMLELYGDTIFLRGRVNQAPGSTVTVGINAYVTL